MGWRNHYGVLHVFRFSIVELCNYVGVSFWMWSWIWIWILVFNATFSNISAISWRPVLMVEEARVPGESPTLGKRLVSLITCGCKSSAPLKFNFDGYKYNLTLLCTCNYQSLHVFMVRVSFTYLKRPTASQFYNMLLKSLNFNFF